MKQLSLYFILSICLSSLYSCDKGPGVGGSSDIFGKVIINYYNNAGEKIGTGVAQDERIYIVYGRNTGFDDDLRTAYDGTYVFNYLQAGTYTVYAYSDCDTCLSGMQAETLTIAINDRKVSFEASDLVLKKIK